MKVQIIQLIPIIINHNQYNSVTNLNNNIYSFKIRFEKDLTKHYSRL